MWISQSVICTIPNGLGRPEPNNVIAKAAGNVAGRSPMKELVHTTSSKPLPRSSTRVPCSRRSAARNELFESQRVREVGRANEAVGGCRSPTSMINDKGQVICFRHTSEPNRFTWKFTML